MEGQNQLNDLEVVGRDDLSTSAGTVHGAVTPPESILTPSEVTRDDEECQAAFIRQRILQQQAFSRYCKAAAQMEKRESPYENVFLHVSDEDYPWQNEIILMTDLIDADGEPQFNKLLGYFEPPMEETLQNRKRSLSYTGVAQQQKESLQLHFDEEYDTLVLNDKMIVINQRQFKTTLKYIMRTNHDGKVPDIKCHIARKQAIRKKY